MIKCIPTQAEGLLVFCRLVFVSLWSLSCLYLDYDKEIPNYDYLKMCSKKFEDTKGVIRNHKSKDKQYNSQNKRYKRTIQWSSKQ